MGNPEKAIPDLDEAIRLSPSLAVAYSIRGLAHTNLADFRQAVKDLNQAVRLNPNFADAYSSRGFAHRAAGRLDRAISDFDQAIRLDVKFSVAYNNRADVYIEMGQPERALPDLDEAIKLDPWFAVAFANRAFAWTLLKDSAKAWKKQIQRARKLYRKSKHLAKWVKVAQILNIGATGGASELTGPVLGDKLEERTGQALASAVGDG